MRRMFREILMIVPAAVLVGLNACTNVSKRISNRRFAGC